MSNNATSAKPVQHIDAIDFVRPLLSWFSKQGRKDLPWQINPTPYRVWVSEIMLQQTQVNTVLPYYLNFMKIFPTLEDLANATDDQVMALWSGLGYYSRARNLHKTALILNTCDQQFPETLEQLLSLPGIGRSTAGAILALAMQKKASILDGNVKRVLARCFAVPGWTGKTSVANQLWMLAEQLTPETELRNYTQAMMDLGATVCTRSNPSCPACPLATICIAKQEDSQTAYPGKKKQTLIPTKHQYFFLLSNKDHQLLLEKRPPVGIWGGLWTPPTCRIEDDTEMHLQQSYGINITNSHQLPDFRHSFSHFHLQLHPIKAQISSNSEIKEGNLRWDKIDNWLKQGIPAAVRLMLEQIKKDFTTTE